MPVHLWQGLLEIAEDTGMGEALQAAGLDVEQLKREVQEKLVRVCLTSATACCTKMNWAPF
jgi:hypothetical protein